MQRIETLTPEQEALIPAMRGRWIGIGLSTEPADREQAEAGAKRVYEVAGLPEPKITIWLRSPLEGCIGAAMLVASRPVRDQVGARVWAQVWDQVRDQVGARVGEQVWDQVGALVRDQVWEQIRAQVAAQVWEQVRAQVGSQLYRCGYGQHDASWLSFYQFFQDACNLDTPLQLEGLSMLAESCGWWWPFAGAVILTERPTTLRRDDRHRLHCEDGSALLYPDGFGIWAWHGVRVDRRLIEQPETITAQQITNEHNAEVRRVMLERFGLDRYVRKSGARLLHQDVSGNGQPRSLWRVEFPDDEPITLIELENSTPEPDGSRKTYMLRVNREIRPMRLLSNGDLWYGEPQEPTCQNAVAASFGLRGEQYAPAVET